MTKTQYDDFMAVAIAHYRLKKPSLSEEEIKQLRNNQSSRNQVFKEYGISVSNVITDIEDIKCKLSAIKANLQLEVLRVPDSKQKLTAYLIQADELEKKLIQHKQGDKLEPIFQRISELSINVARNTSIIHTEIHKYDASKTLVFKGVKDKLKQIKNSGTEEDRQQINNARDAAVLDTSSDANKTPISI